MAPPLLPVGTYLGTERRRGGTEAAVTDQHPKNVHNLHNHEQRTQITQLLVVPASLCSSFGADDDL
jgi:hypothetical protein